MLFLGIGSFSRGGSEGSSINELPLFDWLSKAPLSDSWWLWTTIAILGLLVLNTVFCSIESLRLKLNKDKFLIIIAPQVMHLGFLFIVMAHLISAYGGSKAALPVMEGQTIGLNEGNRVQVHKLKAEIGPMGMPIDFSADLRIWEGPRMREATVAPNNPLFVNGLGIYLKHVELFPVRGAYIEVHREPGALMALIGAIMFTVGNIVLLGIRRGR